jgi:RimJ/RimL family protein N-acetyltransferase
MNLPRGCDADRVYAITFRPMTGSDVPMLHTWLNESGVVQWWEGQDVSFNGVVRHYGTPATPSTEHWIAIAHGRDVGWLQCYLARDNPSETEDWWDYGIDENAAGIDYLVAEPNGRGQGLGSAMINAFVHEIVLGRHPEWTQVCAGPFAANVSSCKALANAGFRFVALIDDEDGPCQLMALDR